MRYKKRKFIIVIIFISILSIIFLNYFVKEINVPYLIKKEKYGEPIGEDGEINNDFFGIGTQENDAQATTEGINAAIEYANENNIEYIKLQQGTYIISGEVDGLENKNEKKGIILKSNITFDLNGSNLVQETNDKVMYSLISVYEVQNVKISNGKLIGDKDGHNYSGADSSHGWGYGIDIKASDNVIIDNVEICDMTGDGISISNLPRNATQQGIAAITSENVKIKNCNIYKVRRNGISVISGENIEIYQNEIHDIEGTLPQTAIDLETNDDINQSVNNVRIYENKIYNLNNASHFAIITYFHVKNVEISNNEIIGRLILYETDDCITIRNNKILNGEILSKISEGRTNAIRKKIIIEDNYLEKSDINLSDVEIIQVINNQLKNSEVTYNNCIDVRIENNQEI